MLAFDFQDSAVAMGIRRSIAAIAVVLFLVVMPFATGTAETVPEQAVKFVTKLGEDAIKVLSVPGATDEERKQRYRELLDEGFAVNTIGRFVVGRYWRSATPEQRKTYLKLYRAFVLDTYTSRLDGYSGQTFKVLKSLPIDKRDTLVATEVVSRKSGAPPIRVDYRVRARDGTLKIVDVIVEGISLIATQRSEFASVINRGGFDSLIELLSSRATKSE